MHQLKLVDEPTKPTDEIGDVDRGGFDPSWDESAILAAIARAEGLTPARISKIADVPLMRTQAAIARLEKAGKIRYAGWVIASPIDSVGDGESSPWVTEIRHPSGERVTETSSLRVRWKPKASSQNTDDRKYAYLYDGTKSVQYIAGPHTNPAARSKVAWVEKWIALGLSREIILDRFPALKAGKWGSPGDR